MTTIGSLSCGSEIVTAEKYVKDGIMNRSDKLGFDPTNSDLSSYYKQYVYPNWSPYTPGDSQYIQNYNQFGFRFDSSSFGVNCIKSVQILQSSSTTSNKNIELSVVAVDKNDETNKIAVATSTNTVTFPNADKGKFHSWNFNGFDLSDGYYYYILYVDSSTGAVITEAKQCPQRAMWVSSAGTWKGAFMGLWQGQATKASTSDQWAPVAIINNELVDGVIVDANKAAAAITATKLAAASLYNTNCETRQVNDTITAGSSVITYITIDAPTGKLIGLTGTAVYTEESAGKTQATNITINWAYIDAAMPTRVCVCLTNNGTEDTKPYIKSWYASILTA